MYIGWRLDSVVRVKGKQKATHLWMVVVWCRGNRSSKWMSNERQAIEHISSFLMNWGQSYFVGEKCWPFSENAAKWQRTVVVSISEWVAFRFVHFDVKMFSYETQTEWWIVEKAQLHDSPICVFIDCWIFQAEQEQWQAKRSNRIDYNPLYVDCLWMLMPAICSSNAPNQPSRAALIR